MRSRAYIKVFLPEGDAQQLLAALPPSPTDYWTKGDEVPGRKGRVLRQETGWVLESDQPATADFGAHVDQLVQTLRVNRQYFDQLPPAAEKIFTLVRGKQGANVGWVLENDVVRLLGEMGFALDLDFYCLE